MSLTPAYPASSAARRSWPLVIWTLLAGTFLVRACGFVYPFISFRLGELALSAVVVGRVLAAFGVGWLLGQLLCGYAADRFGRRITLVGAMAIGAVAMPALAWAQSPTAVFAAAVVAGIVYDAPRPVTSAVVADVFPTQAGRTRVNAVRHFAVNIGAAITGAGGLFAADVGTSALFWANGAACAAFALTAWAVMPPDRPRSAAPRQEQSTEPSRRRFQAALSDRRLWLLWLASLAALTCCAGMFSTLPMLMADDGLSPASYGWTQVVAAVAVIALSPVITPWLSHRAPTGGPMTGLFAASSAMLGAGMGTAGLASSTPATPSQRRSRCPARSSCSLLRAPSSTTWPHQMPVPPTPESGAPPWPPLSSPPRSWPRGLSKQAAGVWPLP